MKHILKQSLLMVPVLVSQSYGLTLSEYKSQMEANNRQMQSYKTSTEASHFKQEGGDVVLAPVFFAQGSYTDDQKPPAIPLLGTRTQTELFTLGFQKKFSTGTSATVSGSLADVKLTGAAFSDPNPSKGSLGISISQSLWKDAFGHATTLRREREQTVYQIESLSMEAQRQQYLVQAEAAFWDLWYLQEEMLVRENSIQRAKRLEGWTSKRLGNGIGDKADLLQAQTLASSRDLQLLMSQDDLVAAKRKVLGFIEKNSETEVKVEGNTGEIAPLETYVFDGGGEDVVSLEAYLSYSQAKLKSTVSKETAEGLKPDLTLEGSYATNSQGDSYNKALNDISQTDKPTSTIALKFSMPFGEDVSSVKKSAALDYESAKTQAQKKWEDAQVQWQELKRRHQELLKKLEISEKLTKLQVDKLTREQQRLNQGRTTTAQVITFEQDAADTQLTLLKLKAERKKLETQARLFIKARRDTL